MSDWLHYFAYGSNMYPPRLRERTPSSRHLGTAVLPGYRLAFHQVSRGDGSAKCNIVPVGDGQHTVYGVVYAVHREERPVLDRAEDLDYGYRLVDLAVRQATGWREAFCYVAVPGTIDDRARPFRWYRDLVLRGALEHGFPRPYVEAIRAEPAVEDPDPERSAHHEDLLGFSVRP